MWVRTPAPCTGWCKQSLAITLEKEIKVAKWGTPKNNLKRLV
jgi:hypothetical protein